MSAVIEGYHGTVSIYCSPMSNKEVKREGNHGIVSLYAQLLPDKLREIDGVHGAVSLYSQLIPGKLLECDGFHGTASTKAIIFPEKIKLEGSSGAISSKNTLKSFRVLEAFTPPLAEYMFPLVDILNMLLLVMIMSMFRWSVSPSKFALVDEGGCVYVVMGRKDAYKMRKNVVRTGNDENALRKYADKLRDECIKRAEREARRKAKK
jgi:hypothetical protein